MREAGERDGMKSHRRCNAQMCGEMLGGLLGGKCAWREDLNMVQTVDLIVYYISMTHVLGGGKQEIRSSGSSFGPQ